MTRVENYLAKVTFNLSKSFVGIGHDVLKRELIVSAFSLGRQCRCMCEAVCRNWSSQNRFHKVMDESYLDLSVHFQNTFITTSMCLVRRG